LGVLSLFLESISTHTSLDEEKTKHVDLTQQFCEFVKAGKWQQQSYTPAREECNKYDLTTSPYFSLVDHNDWSRWFAIR